MDGPRLNLGFHPLCDDLTESPNQKVKVFHQELILCEKCLTAHQIHQVNKEELFPKNYHYRSSLTQDVLDGMKDLVESVFADSSFSKEKNIKILDVGCNDGSLLNIFRDKFKNTTLIGVDPTDAIKQSKDLDYSIQSFFDDKISTDILSKVGKVDIITFTNVFAHIEDIQQLCANIEKLMHEKTILIIENHYLGSILKNHQFDTFYHEHPRTYSATSFKYIATLLRGFVKKIEFPKRYGGNIRITITKNIENPLVEFPNELNFIDKFSKLQDVYNEWMIQSKEFIKKNFTGKKIAGKSLPGRAVMLISSLDLNAEIMPKIFEKPSSPKINHFVPNTDIIVKSDDDVDYSQIEEIIIWGWHIAPEILNYLKKLGFRGNAYVPLPEFKQIE
jgi:Methyltransferase domain/C-methyltransferase C-terminal domain